ncbi:MAG: hypothetical protein LBP64_07280 [Tannerella sp.]|jgi:hypothetical protein|nr:hypothetical protein [Tannerella sp.]
MKKIFIAVIICITGIMPVSAQSEGEKYTPFQFSFIYPLGTNGIHAPEYTNSVSINLLGGISRNEKAFTLGGLANIIRHNAGGFQIAGLFNHIGNEGKGFLLSGLVSYTGNGYKGFQIAGLSNITKDVEGVQFAGLFNAAKDVKGVRFAGLSNIAKDVEGVQIAGLFNVAKDVKGVQFAGLLNVAERNDYPIALVNIIKHGEKGISLSYSETGSAIVSFRSGGRVTYGIVGYGYNHKAEGSAFVAEGGLGAHIRCGSRFNIKNEVKIENFISKNTTFKAGYHLLPAYRITPHLEVFAGPGINYMQTDDLRNAGLFSSGISLWKKQEHAKIKQVHIGCSAGIQFIL